MEKEISKKDIVIHAKSKNEVYLMLTDSQRRDILVSHYGCK